MKTMANRIAMHVSVTLLLVTTLYAAASGNGGAVLFAVPKGQYLSNCGLNCTLFCLEYYASSYACKDVAGRLEVGPEFTNPVSFAAIADTLQSYGLECQGYRTSDIIAEVEQTRSETVYILALSRRSNQVDHYGILINGKRGMVVWLGMRSEPILCDKAKVLAILERWQFSDKYLRVRIGQETAHDVSEGEKDVIDLGDIPRDDEEIEISIRIENNEDEPYDIVDVRGACNCFRGWEGKALVPAHGASEILVKLDKKKMAGAFMETIYIKTNSPHELLKKVRVRGRILPGPEDGAINWWPREINYGRVKRASLRSKRLHIWIPEEVGITEEALRINTDSEKITYECLSKTNKQTAKGFRGAEYVYEISWIDPPVGEFRYCVEFSVPDREKRVKVLVMGEAL